MATLSKSIAIDYFSRDRQLVTRCQERRIRATFPFLRLPPELRNLIYDLCLSFRGVETFFDNYYVKLKDSRRPHGVQPPRHPRRCPTVLLLCRQVYAEAVVLLQKKTVAFHHGLLDIRGIDHVISTHTLRHLSSIEITAKGHPILKRNIAHISWVGYMDLLSSLALILAEGHSLKKLLIDLSDEDLALHTGQCWHNQNTCEFRDHLQEALNNLRKVRNVGCVEFKGIDPAFARDLKLRMESKTLSFRDLPGEIRNKIYEHTADYSTVSTQLRKTMTGWIDHTKTPPYPPRSTPTILLLNKQITKEATEIIKSKPLNLVLPDDHNMEKQAEVPNLLKFITAPTLQKVQHLNIVIESWEWMYSLEDLLPALAGKHSLKSFNFTFKDNLKGIFMGAQTKKYPDRTLHMSLSALTNIRGIANVTINGDLPEVYTRPLTDLMHGPIDRARAPTLQAIRGNGEVVDADGDED